MHGPQEHRGAIRVWLMIRMTRKLGRDQSIRMSFRPSILAGVRQLVRPVTRHQAG